MERSQGLCNDLIYVSNSKQIEANPYSYLIDISDLFRGLNIDTSVIEANVQTMLLRHNSTLK